MLSFFNKRKGVDTEKILEDKGSLTKIKNWYQDRYQVVTIQRNIMLIVTMFSLVALIISVSLMATLAGSKTFEPFIIQVEEKTGVVTQVDAKSVEKYRADEAIVRYFLVKYVRARESYDVHNYGHFYTQVVGQLSTRDVNQQFRKEIDSRNPESPINLGANAMRTVEIKSITFLDRKKVQVRIAVNELSVPGMSLKERTHYILTISYDFFELEMSTDARYINPLGFKVTSYQKDIENVVE